MRVAPRVIKQRSYSSNLLPTLPGACFRNPIHVGEEDDNCQVRREAACSVVAIYVRDTRAVTSYGTRVLWLPALAGGSSRATSQSKGAFTHYRAYTIDRAGPALLSRKGGVGGRAGEAAKQHAKWQG